MQKISWIHKLILSIQLILGSYKLHHVHFWPFPIINITFSSPEFAAACKISVHSINSFLRYSQFLSPVTRLTKAIFDRVHPKNFWSIFNLCELVSTCKKSCYFIELFWRYSWLKNPAIWLADNILAHISGTKISPSMGFAQEQQII